MKKTLLYALPLLAVACSSEEIENMAESNYDSAQELQGVVMTIPDFYWEDGTRTSLTEAEHGMTFAWAEGDQVGVYASSSMASFNIGTIGSDAKSASFNGGGFSLTAGETYYSFSPYNGNGTEKISVPVSYVGQIQNGNANTSHLGAYDFMASKATAYATNEALFQYSHLGAMMRIKLNVPAGVNCQSLKINSSGTPFVTAGTVDLTAETPVITATGTSNEITLGLDFATSGDELLTLYAMVAPVDLSSSTITLTLTDDTGSEYTTEVAGKNMQAGSAYGFEGNLNDEGDDGIPYVTFTADAEQTFRLTYMPFGYDANSSYYDEVITAMEYSVNNEDWVELGTKTVTFGGEYGNLRLRGKSPLGANGAVSCFGNDTKVACSGDIRTLVDYENYTTVYTGEAIFHNLFWYCKQLTSGPDLPSMVLAPIYCYSRMFQGCTSLEKAPVLPATNLESYTYCYEYMFEGCTSMEEAPELPATTLESYCYYNMFSGCTSLKKAPELPASKLVQGCYSNMFYGCTNLNYIKMMATDISASSCLSLWVYGVSSSGTFVKNSAATWDKTGNSGIPSGWTVETESF